MTSWPPAENFLVREVSANSIANREVPICYKYGLKVNETTQTKEQNNLGGYSLLSSDVDAYGCMTRAPILLSYVFPTM